MSQHPPHGDSFGAVARAAVGLSGVASAAVFFVPPGSEELVLGAAEGVAGLPLDRLVEAVRDPGHPIARTVSEATTSFDVTPMAPGGPALRSHLPLLVESNGASTAVGVLAVAHDESLDDASRAHLVALAARARALVRDPGRAAIG